MKRQILGAGIALSTCFALTSAQAADFGGNCCADLEERIAELEATTARKGNRKVSLTIYGQVNQAIGYWDDGVETNTYNYTNDTSRTRFGFKGKAKFGSGWEAGYRIEIGVRAEDQGALGADNDDGGTGLDIRHTFWYIGNKKYGKINVGETSMAHDGITQNQTAKIGHFANPDVLDANDSFAIRQSGTGANIGQWDNLAMVLEPGEGSRGSLVRYDSPKLAGFTAHAHWGEDDIWGIALKYKDKVGNFKIRAGIGYGQISERDEECLSEAGIQALGGGVVPHGARCRELGMSASVLHKPTGLFLTGAYGIRWDEGRDAALRAGQAALVASAGAGDTEELKMYHIQAGIEQKWVSLGPTTIFGGYHNREAGFAVRDNNGNLNNFNGTITNFEFDMWEVGFNQHISAAVMDIYVHYKHYDAEITDSNLGSVNSEPWQTVIMGSRIKF